MFTFRFQYWHIQHIDVLLILKSIEHSSKMMLESEMMDNLFFFQIYLAAQITMYIHVAVKPCLNLVTSYYKSVDVKHIGFQVLIFNTMAGFFVLVHNLITIGINKWKDDIS